MFSFLYDSILGKGLILLLCAIIAYIFFRLIKFFILRIDDGNAVGGIILNTPLQNIDLISDVMAVTFRERNLNLREVRVQNYGTVEFETTEGIIVAYSYLITCSYEGNMHQASKACSRGLYLCRVIFGYLSEYLDDERMNNNGHEDEETEYSGSSV